MDKKINDIEIAVPKSKENTKQCEVITYVPETGILGFMFDKTPCQIIVDKNLKIYKYVDIKYEGSIKDGIKFHL